MRWALSKWLMTAAVLLLSVPVFALAGEVDNGLIFDDCVVYEDPDDPNSRVIGNSCDYNHLFDQINAIIAFIATVLMPLVITGYIAYAGFIYVTAGSNPGQRSRAKVIFRNIIIGAVLFYASYVIVSLFISSFNVKTEFNRFEIGEEGNTSTTN